MRTALTIAGSDSGGGAGIQADLKTFAAHGVFGTSAITAVTAQNTLGVVAWEALSTDLVIAQIEAVAGDIGADAVKAGMLANRRHRRGGRRGDRGHEPAARRRRSGDDRERGRPAAARPMRSPPCGRSCCRAPQIVTPNVPEAEVLAGMPVRSLDDMREAGRRILELGPRVVLVKGGHLDGPDSIDVACTPAETFDIRRPRIDTRHTHGTGCTLSSAIAANLALGLADRDAIERARDYLDGAIRHAPGLGGGHGPLNHFWRAVY